MFIPEISASKVAGLIGLHKVQKPAEVIYSLLLKDAAAKATIAQIEAAHRRQAFNVVANKLTREQPIMDIISEGLRQCRATNNVQSVLRNVEDQANIIFDLRYDQFEPAVRAQKLWFKGESSGHTQDVIRWYADCDKDCLLFEVKQTTGACHTGYESCFFQPYDMNGSPLPVGEKPVFDAEQIYSKE